MEADKIIERAHTLLVDAGADRWGHDEMLQWLNDAVLAIISFRPDANVVTEAVQLVAGTKQSLPAGALRLEDVVRNMGADGETPSRPISFIERRQLDLDDPGWHGSIGSTVFHWAYSQENPKVWWCYPGAGTSSRPWVELAYSKVPDAMTVVDVDGATDTSDFPLEETFINPALSFMVYRAFSKDLPETAAGGRSQVAYSEFLQLLGIKSDVRKKFDPRKKQPPYNTRNEKANQGAFGDEP